MADELSIRCSKNSPSYGLSQVISSALEKALALDHKLVDAVFKIDGMSGRKYRSFINSVVEQVDDPRYLEVGSWKGSTACAAMYGNSARIVCIDNWSGFGGPKEDFVKNIEMFKGNNDFEFVEADFRRVNYGNLGKFNIYLFDGPHTAEDQYEGIRVALPALDAEFILIVDDWNWPSVRSGTMSAIEEMKLTVQNFVEVRTTQDDTHPVEKRGDSDWHNGYYFAHVRQPQSN